MKCLAQNLPSGGHQKRFISILLFVNTTAGYFFLRHHCSKLFIGFLLFTKSVFHFYASGSKVLHGGSSIFISRNSFLYFFSLFFELHKFFSTWESLLMTLSFLEMSSSFLLASSNTCKVHLKCSFHIISLNIPARDLSFEFFWSLFAHTIYADIYSHTVNVNN